MAFTQVDLGDPAAALAPAAQALDLLRAMGPNVMPYARIQEVLGRAHLALGHHRQAADHLSRAIAVYRDKDLPEATELAGLLATAQARQPTATPGRMPCPAR
jgi:tetratricopeptide (TPR) repeat protein